MIKSLAVSVEVNTIGMYLQNTFGPNVNITCFIKEKDNGFASVILTCDCTQINKGQIRKNLSQIGYTKKEINELIPENILTIELPSQVLLKKMFEIHEDVHFTEQIFCSNSESVKKLHFIYYQF
jgi:hypothetical protein